MKRSFVILFAAALAVAFMPGCTKKQGKSVPLYEFKSETRANIVELRAALKSEDLENVSMSKGWGFIDWMAPEGSEVASGEVVVRINMDESRQSLRRREKDLANQTDRKNNLLISGPAEIADLHKNLREKELELQKAIAEEKWLKDRKKQDEIWKIYSDVQIASISFHHARNMYELQKNVTEKGFDSPFILRSSEIDKRSREIELEYARRVRDSLKDPPLAEELARLQFQKQVASGEIWLSQTQLQAASISSQLRGKNFEVVIERYNSQIRELERSLEDSELKAPRSGILIHPIIWGDFKFKPGSQAWSGVTIVQVVGSEKFFLEAMAAEADSNILKEKASATVEFDSLPGQLFPGEVRSISRSPRALKTSSTSQMRVFPVQINCRPDQEILVGSMATVKVNLGERSGVFLPREALQKQGEGWAVLLRSTFSEALVTAEIEDFNQDWVIWKNAPSEQGVIVYP